MKFIDSLKTTYAIGAAPMGRPGCPLFALFTPSMARKRMALTHLVTSSLLSLAGVETAAARGTRARARCSCAGRIAERGSGAAALLAARPVVCCVSFMFYQPFG